ncbi:hypothetical protein DdX_20601 [Ditylenchus destructor]|uniref:Integrase catalytic domain-containing protein n=1 Tax=Ditylenchus destructor TaxID=166010 RepID=A0AAD4MIH2_9BILA|nr:hypothetical protein DdX_20601 [Ditylenchus destructor]
MGTTGSSELPDIVDFPVCLYVAGSKHSISEEQDLDPVLAVVRRHLLDPGTEIDTDLESSQDVLWYLDRCEVKDATLFKLVGDKERHQRVVVPSGLQRNLFESMHESILDMFTKFVVSVPVPDTKALTLATAFVEEFVLKYSTPTQIVSDNAKTFSAEFIAEGILAKFLSMKKGKSFDELLNATCFAYNTSVHVTTGDSPFFLMFGRTPVMNIDVILNHKRRDPYVFTPVDEFRRELLICLRTAWTSAAEISAEHAQAMEKRANRGIKPQIITEGDVVMLKRTQVKPGQSPKFRLTWKGLFRVISIDEPHAFIQSCESPQEKLQKVHLNQIKKYLGLKEPDAPGPALTLPQLTPDTAAQLKEHGAEPMSGRQILASASLTLERKSFAFQAVRGTNSAEVWLLVTESGSKGDRTITLQNPGDVIHRAERLVSEGAASHIQTEITRPQPVRVVVKPTPTGPLMEINEVNRNVFIFIPGGRGLEGARRFLNMAGTIFEEGRGRLREIQAQERRDRDRAFTPDRPAARDNRDRSPLPSTSRDTKSSRQQESRKSPVPSTSRGARGSQQPEIDGFNYHFWLTFFPATVVLVDIAPGSGDNGAAPAPEPEVAPEPVVAMDTATTPPGSSAETPADSSSAVANDGVSVPVPEPPSPSPKNTRKKAGRK